MTASIVRPSSLSFPPESVDSPLVEPVTGAARGRGRALPTLLTLAILVTAAAPACDPERPRDEIPVGLLLSYTGYLAANSSNNERAVLMAIEAANQAGGVSGLPIRVMARDTRSDPRKAVEPTQELLDARLPVIIGPDYGDVTAHLEPLLEHQTTMLPSFATFDYIQYKPESWFVMGPGPKRFACELVAQARADGHKNVVQVVSPNNFNAVLSWTLSNDFGLTKHAISATQASTIATVQPLADALSRADAYLLAASPDVAASLVYALTAIGALDEPERWYLSPTLHTPAFFESIPKGAMIGSRGVAPGTVAGGADFRAQFTARWHEPPLDDAYPFYDAAAVAVLALQRALRDEGAIPTGTGISRHLIAVTKAGATPVQWNEIGRGLELLRQNQEVEYFGLKGQLQFDAIGRTQAATAKWWAIREEGVSDIPRGSDCK
jgi:ABC-type branched-subunit amino acid transport system substrate-binding protein